MPQPVRALIAEDEPLLAQALQAELAQAWPQLQVLALCGDGLSAERQALQLQPEVLFLDIRMPGQSGLETAAALAEAWPDEATPFPLLVFVTAYDQYAVQAFEAQAMDYLLKPVQPQRLQKTVQKLQNALAQRGQPAIEMQATMARLAALLQRPDWTEAGIGSHLHSGMAAPAAEPLQLLQVAKGQRIELVPVDQVVYFEAADKYVRVLTPTAEYLLRTPLKELAARLNPVDFWQVHRGALVQARHIVAAERDAQGRLQLLLRGRPERLAVSRLHAARFKAM